MLLAGTYDGVYRAQGPRFDSADRVLGAGRVLRVRRFDGWEGVFAASKTGLYRSTDGGEMWTDLGVPREEVYSVLGDPAGERLYAGTHPAHLYVSEDEGETWRELEGFQDLPSRDEWYTPRHRNESHIRSLGAHPDAPDRVVAGVEVGGVHVSDDGGETWTERKGGVRASDASAGSSRAERSDGVHDDVHHVLVVGPDEYAASCGGGLYRTRDAGETWTRLDESLDHTYFREAFAHDGVLYAAAARSSPGTWRGETGADAALFESRDGVSASSAERGSADHSSERSPREDEASGGSSERGSDGGDSFEALAYPGRPEEVVLAWATHDGEVVAGTNDGRILVRETDGWVGCGELPEGISSLCGV